MVDVTQQKRPFDARIDDITLKAERYGWTADKLELALRKANVPSELVKSVIDFYIKGG